MGEFALIDMNFGHMQQQVIKLPKEPMPSRCVSQAGANISTSQDDEPVLALPHKRPRSARATTTVQHEAMHTNQLAGALRRDATAQGCTTAAIIASTSALNISQPNEDQQDQSRREALQYASAMGNGEPMEEEGTSEIEAKVSSQTNHICRPPLQCHASGLQDSSAWRSPEDGVMEGGGDPVPFSFMIHKSLPV